MFPFPTIRPEQQLLVNDVTAALASKQHLVAHAPTGLGKTAATLAPAVEYAVREGKTVFFLTSRHSQHQIAIETLRLMKEWSEKNFIATDVIGKKWLCSMVGADTLDMGDFSHYCRSLVREERCRFYAAARTKHRLLTPLASAALDDILRRQPCHAEEFQALSPQFCAYEVLMEMAKRSQVIVGDYFHLFSPLRETLFIRLGKQLENAIIIVDEAHNLGARIRDLLSRKLTSFSIRAAQQEAEQAGLRDLADSVAELHDILRSLAAQKLAYDDEVFVQEKELTGDIKKHIGHMTDFTTELLDAGEEVLKEKKKSALHNIGVFLTHWTADDVGFARIIKKSKTKIGKPYYSLVHTCLDPMTITKEIADQCHSLILMSGTMQPLDMHAALLGLDPQRTMQRAYLSPFPKKNRLNVIVPDTTTRYAKRSAETYTNIARYVLTCVHAIPGNVAVFYPSYEFRDRVVQEMGGNLKKELVKEIAGSTKENRHLLYDQFVAARERGAVLMAVQGGSFGEGIDFPGTYLNGVIIVGVPLERPDLETKALIDYYDARFKRGWDYGYIYPAMIRSIQAAGRCIRSETDRGVCIFLDERFLWSNYRKVFPPELDMRITKQPELLINDFFKRGSTTI
ncbi:MAG: ATP-dependent DNA helicase [Candidatus Aenigmarchaeota archaeon]|nr:ATP-dependent DNA helicase [Candidatus Aenigmarchaeota archaeon]